MREATIPNAKRYITPIRERLESDTVQHCLKTQIGVPGIIEARDEFDDLDLLFSWKTPFKMERQNHSYLQPWYVRHNGEEIRVNLIDVEKHFKSQNPYNLRLQRYIVGRPNLLRMPVVPVREDKSLHFQAGTQFH